MYGVSAQAKLTAAGIPFTTQNIYENRFHGTAIVFHTRYMAHKAVTVIGCDPIHLRKIGKTWQINYFG